MREEVEDALRCLLPLTARPQQRSSLNRALGLVATSPAHPGLDALLNLASAEGGPALQVRSVTPPPPSHHLERSRDCVGSRSNVEWMEETCERG